MQRLYTFAFDPNELFRNDLKINYDFGSKGGCL